MTTATAKPIRYRRPETLGQKKGFALLAKSDIMLAAVQIIQNGGEQGLHSHSAMDGLWFVLSGRVRFYGPEDVLIVEAGRYEGVFIPRDVEYWFEGVGDEPLELLQVEAIDPRIRNTVQYKGKSGIDRTELLTDDGALIKVMEVDYKQDSVIDYDDENQL